MSSSLTRPFDLNQATVAVLSVFLGIMAMQASWGPTRSSPSDTDVIRQGAPCEGDPIPVSYPYANGMAAPHECLVQCREGGRRYILYSDGVGTQCQTPPGCSDWGEDNGVTCIPPPAS